MDQTDESVSPRHSHHSKRSRRGNVLIGRLYLIGLFTVSRAQDVWIYFTTPEYLQQEILKTLVPFAIVSTALYAALIARQGWARYVLILLHMYFVVSYMIVIPMIVEQFPGDRAMMFRIIIRPVWHCIAAWALICSRDIHRVGSRTYE